MFKSREQLDTGLGGPAASVAALSYAQLLAEGAETETAQYFASLASVSSRWKGFCLKVEARLHKLNLIHDLAEDIGSARWYRGLGTMLGLGAAALLLWPDFAALEAATTLPVETSMREEFRSQMILPLAYGADSGRHMAATALVAPIAAVPERSLVRMVATLGQGDSFGRMLQRAGVGAGDASKASELIAASVPLGDIASGTRFDVTMGRRAAPGQPRPLDKLDFRARFDLDLAIYRRDGGLALTTRAIAVDATPLRIRGVVGPSLYRSARAAGAPAAAIQQYLQTLDAHISLEGDIAPTDMFDIIVAHKRSASGESETGDLLYAGLDRGGKSVTQLLRWGGDGQFFEASGLGSQQQARGGMVAPVSGHITSGYGMRYHPILGYTRMHAGIDFGAAWGSPIYAVSDGMVSFAGHHGGHGNYVRLEHGGGLGTGYGHMSRIAVSQGMRVHTGQVIGFVGSTGLSTGPHLHYEVYRGGQTINPQSVQFTIRAPVVDGKELAAFKSKLAQVKAIGTGAALGKTLPNFNAAKLVSGKIAKLAP